MSRVLVTGGSGFIGVFAMKRLVENGHRVVNYDLVPPSEERAYALDDVKDQVTFERGGVDDLPSLLSVVKKHGVEKIVHMAAIVDPVTCHVNPGITYRINLGGTINVLEIARIMGLKRVVYLSSIGVYTTKKYEPIDENHPVLQSNEGPASTAYGASKIGSEAFCWAYRETFNVDFVVLRPSAAYGLGMKVENLIKPLVECAVRGERLELEHGRDYPRDYTYVKDIAKAIQLAVEVDRSRLKDRVFLVSTGHKLSTPGQVSEIIKEFIPTSQIRIGPGLEGFDEREILFRGVLDISRARSQLGFEPEFDIRKGTRDYMEMYRLYLAKTQEMLRR